MSNTSNYTNGNQMNSTSLTFEEIVAAYQSWWDDYKSNPNKYVDYDKEDYDDSKYAVDSATIFLEHLTKIKGE